MERLAQLEQRLARQTADFLKDLISIESHAGTEAAVAQRVKEEMLDLGFDEVWTDDLGSVIGRVGQGPFTILYDAHMDTDEVSDPEEWDQDPLEPVERDGIIFGLGASDDKQGVASIVQTGGVLKELGTPPEVTLYVFSTVMEESSEGAALRHFIRSSGIKPNAVLICEASKLDLCIGHRGRTELKLRTKGRSAHASRPELGDNAILKMLKVVGRLEEEIPTLLPEVEPFGKGSQALTVISSPSSVNAIPAWCEAWYDRRLVPGETVESVLGPIRVLTDQLGAEVEIPSYRLRSYTGTEVQVQAFFPGWSMDAEHPWVQAAAETYRVVFGKQPVIRLWPFSTDGTCSAGEFGIPTVGFGPSAEEFAHSARDQVSVQDLGKAVRFLTALPWVASRAMATGRT
jgi:putative selenium metabolism hydrolase